MNRTLKDILVRDIKDPFFELLEYAVYVVYKFFELIVGILLVIVWLFCKLYEYLKSKTCKNDRYEEPEVYTTE